MADVQILATKLLNEGGLSRPSNSHNSDKDVVGTFQGQLSYILLTVVMAYVGLAFMLTELILAEFILARFQLT